ncbi:MAG: glycoside hydrolase family 15 protein, partial [Chloroflexi bacterium]|nr:glycoside hydrolase family 15 protein [Chloroflexota bacterium]
LENHVSGHEIKVGISVDGDFSWLREHWTVQSRYMPETLVSVCNATRPGSDIRLEVNDGVHYSLDVFMRKVSVQNTGNIPRKVRLFFTHDLHIYGDAVGDTVMYDAESKGMIHYKRKRYFLMNGATSQGNGIYQFAAGYKESAGMEGTWKDAEDGILSGNPIAQGSVDSVISLDVDVAPQATETIYYWIACETSLGRARELDSRVRSTGVEWLLLETENYWSAWVNKKGINLSLLPRHLKRLYKTSLLVMRSHMDTQGGIIASCDSDILRFNRDTYSYVWPRDGAIAAIALDLAGFPEVSRHFFQFCSRTIGEKGYFHHKYSPDGSVGSTWLASVDSAGKLQLPIQEDETALVLYALWRHFKTCGDIEFISSVYENLVLKTTEFMLEYVDSRTALPRTSFDVWEEKSGVFTWTTATVCAALSAAAGFARVFYDSQRHERLTKAAMEMKNALTARLYDPVQGRFIKGLAADGSQDLSYDCSVAGVFIYHVLKADDDLVNNTMISLADRLWVKGQVGGLARHDDDGYLRVDEGVPGNPWFVGTLWLARWHIARARSSEQLKKGLDLLSWTASHSLPSGMLSEQMDPHTGGPVSVCPLVWSHAEFVIASCEYLEKLQELSSQDIQGGLTWNT